MISVDAQMVEDSIDEGGVVVYEESGEMVDCADGDGSTVVEWAEEDVAEQEVSTNFSPFEGKIIYHTPPSSDNTPKMVRTKGEISTSSPEGMFTLSNFDIALRSFRRRLGNKSEKNAVL